MLTKDYIILFQNNRMNCSYKSTILEAMRMIKNLLNQSKNLKSLNYQVLYAENSIYLTRNSIHRNEIKKASNSLSMGNLILPDRIEVIKLKSQALLEVFKHFRDISKASQRFKQNIFFTFTSFFNNFYNYLLLVCALRLTIGEKASITEINTFELGSSGLAVSKYCEEKGLSSRFIQHGLFDIFLSPVKFNYYCLWNQWDKDFINLNGPIANNNNTTLKYPQKLALLRIPHECTGIFFALDYPTKHLKQQRIIQKVSEIQKFCRRRRIKLVIKPHPSSSKKLIRAIERIVSNELISSGDIERSFIESDCNVLLVFNSASIIKVANLGYPCCFFQNGLTNFIWAPFSEFAHQIRHDKDLFRLFS